MKVVTYKDNRIAIIKDNIDFESNGNVLIGNNQSIGFWLIGNIYDIENIPENIEEEKYCYTNEDGFYINENYIEPIIEPTYEELEKQVEELQNTISELQTQVANNN